MERIEQVIILGAGASKSEGAPLQNELFKEYIIDFHSIDIHNYIAIIIFALFAFFAVRFLY
jgi:hypothetical protein